MRFKRIFCACLALCFLVGCTKSGSDPAPVSALPDQSSPTAAVTPPPEEETFTPYTAPPFADAVFHEETQDESGTGVRLDLSATAEGYIGISAMGEGRLKLVVNKEDCDSYQYNIASDGTPSIFPIQEGSGTYTFWVGQHVEGTESKYVMVYSATAEVTLKDEFQPFIRPSDYVNYSQSSQCVKKAAELASQSADEVDLVGHVFDYICENVTYDTPKASSVPAGYLADPDETMRTGKGICIDYAALAAAMLRSQGIPTKMIYGYVSPNDLYHAWNMFYTDETGWVTVEYKVSEDTWNRLDLTFSANGADETFIGDGSNYADVYVY